MYLQVHSGCVMPSSLQVMESAMSSATTLTTPQDQVEALIKQVADESGMEVIDQLETAKVGSTVPQETLPTLTTKQEDELSRR